MKKLLNFCFRVLFSVFLLFLINSCNPPVKISCPSGKVIKKSSNLVDTLISGTTRDLLCINMNTIGLGYISGEKGVILKTLNGGNNWFAQSSSTSNDLNGIYALDSDSAVSAGNNGVIIRTTNKGSVWDTVTSGTPQNLNSVFFSNKNTGYICGNNGVLLKSTNGGRTWLAQTSGTINNLFCINFISTDTGVTIGQNGTILQTFNGGINWITRTSPVNSDLYGIDFIDAKAMAVGASGKIIRTSDYGVTWDTIQSSTVLTLRSIVWCQQKIAYAVGQNGVSLRFNGISWSTGPQGTSNNLNFVHSPFWKKGSDIRLASAWAVGDDGTILLLNPSICNIGVVSLTNTDSCNWCFTLNLTSPTSPGPFSPLTNYTHFVFGTSTIHLFDWCQPREMNVIGYAQYENTGQITTVPISSGTNFYDIKVYGFNPGTAFPANFKFYLYDAVTDNSCYIELDDILCCPE